MEPVQNPNRKPYYGPGHGGYGPGKPYHGWPYPGNPQKPFYGSPYYGHYPGGYGGYQGGQSPGRSVTGFLGRIQTVLFGPKR